MSGAGVVAGILVLGLGTLAMKAVGPVLAGGPRRSPPVLDRIGLILPPALLSALVATDLLGTGVDARLAGTVVAGAAVALRAPFLAVVLIGTAATALLRALGLP